MILINDMFEADSPGTYRLMRFSGKGDNCIKNSKIVYIKTTKTGKKYYTLTESKTEYIYSKKNRKHVWANIPMENYGYVKSVNPYYGVGSITHINLLKDGSILKTIKLHYDDFPYTNLKIIDKNIVSFLQSKDDINIEMFTEMLKQAHINILNSKNKEENL